MKKFRETYKGYLIRWSNQHNLYFVWSKTRIPLDQFAKLSDARAYVDEKIKEEKK